MTGVQTCALPICFPVTISVNQFRGFVNVECHGTGANYLFADGHVEFIPWTEVQRRLSQPDSAFITP